VLRRIVNADGSSRAFIDDQPTSVALLRRAGEMLVEIEAQFAQRGLLDPATHREALDAHGGHEPAVAAMGAAWTSWRAVAGEREAASAALARTRAEEDALRLALAELDALAPKEGEEMQLAQERALLLNRERILEALDAAAGELTGERGGEHALNAAHRQLERLRDKAAGRFEAALAALERAGVELREAVDAIEAQRRALDRDAAGLERVEERLHLLRTLARKHGMAADALPARRAEIARRIAALDDGGERVKALERREREARDAYIKAAEGVSRARQRAAAALDQAVMRELPPLRLEKARFSTVLAPLAPADWSQHGAERVHFEVATNPGVPAGPLSRIASGGELARFMLALKVVLAGTAPAPTLVFDEVDSGIGGAIAAAVGERLHRLGRELQVLVVTHSPQVAARATHHWRVVKEQARHKSAIRVDALDDAARREEIARMLSGTAVTAEARAAAASLIAGTAP
jgi:DNA repair protein RecN (Recombination protein N)